MITRNFWSLSAALFIASAVPSFAQEHFDSAEDAANALIQAVSSHDTARMSAILGPTAKALLTSGNATQDNTEQSEFAERARAKHRLEISPMNPNRAVLAIGDEDWPFPVPIVRAKGKWSFDCSSAPTEMHARRIGTDEMDAVEICRGYVEAQKKYASVDRSNNGMLHYASHLMSTPGKQDGLYWDSDTDPLVPAAFAHAEWTATGHAKPYHGYYFRILDKQGANAPDGAHTYILKNTLVGGFGLVAWPAEYGVTGIHTFIVNQNGIVYQKDIAPAPAQPRITAFDPDPTWKPVD
ncbi:MAG TPA: DUF2950 domain-containing protein [Bryobacteraceae bacterium]|nr:DUF2950 domain-containing protein [Bryobacteraceae bacterium]